MDKNVLTTVFLKYHSILIAIAKRRMANSDEAKDAVSEAYLKLLVNWGKFPELKGEEDCLKLAKYILINFTINDQLRKRGKSKNLVELEMASLATCEESDDEEPFFLIEKILGMIDLTVGESNILPFIIEGYPNRDIAKVLGVTPEEVSKPRSTLIRKLRKVIQRNQINRS